MTGISAVTRSSPLAVFRNRNFRYMWTAQLSSTIGSLLMASLEDRLRKGQWLANSMPRSPGLDQQSLRDLRTSSAQPVVKGVPDHAIA